MRISDWSSDVCSSDLLDAAQLSRALDDVDAAVINTNFALEAGLDPQTDAVAREAREGNPYANVIAVRTENKADPAIRKFVAASESPEVAEFLETRVQGTRSEERRVGKECVSKCVSRGWRYK